MSKILLDHVLNDTSEREIQKLVINTRQLPTGKRLRVICFELDKPVSMKQHRYWRMICKFVERETGNEANEFHKHCKTQFAKTMITVNNQSFEFVPSMANMSMSDAADFITKSINFIEETFGIECPRPDNVPPDFAVRMGFSPNDFY